MKTVVHRMVGGLVMVLILAPSGRIATGQATQEFLVDPALSTVLVHVGRAGLFSFAGHEHEVAAPNIQGSILLDAADVARSRVTLRFEARTMRVTGRGEPPEDVPEVQRTMLSDRVLDAQRYPTIRFESDRVSMQAPSSDGFRLRVEGTLTLHGTSRRVAVPVAVRLSGGQIAATGTATVRQTAYGIRPVTAAAGTVRVKDDVTVAFTIVARRP
jgi:polyisoprenoid-binding protein YceI